MFCLEMHHEIIKERFIKKQRCSGLSYKKEQSAVL